MTWIFSALSAATLAHAFEDDGCSREGFSAGGAAKLTFGLNASDVLSVMIPAGCYDVQGQAI